MKMPMKIKLLFLAGVIALSLALGTLGVASTIQANNSAPVAGPCWRCFG
jgi:hypothetical protein